MEWISVKERLPTQKEDYIICLINENPILAQVHDYTFCLTTNTLSFFWPTQKWIKDKYFGDVTHWMSLPKPPRE